MAEELGTWPAEQATVLLEVLQKAGLTPEAKRTRDGVLVTVPSEQADEANRQLVANMDAIAKAARQPRSSSSSQSGRRPRAVKGADNQPERSAQQLSSERLMRIAKPLGLILIGLLLLGVIRNPIVVVAVVAVLVYFLGKRAQRGGDDPREGGL
ncbi:MAG: hypothetical protein ACLFRD_08420 [Nitriliruptoraceae bacterium]